MRRLTACMGLLAALLVSSRGLAGELPPGWEAAMAGGIPVAVTAEAVQVEADKLTGLAPRGAWVLRGGRGEFGGLSGLLVRDGQIFAVSDAGWWFGAALSESPDGLGLSAARMAPMRDLWGLAYGKAGGDAEGLAWDGARLAVSFERDHRVMRLGVTSRMEEPVRLPGFSWLSANKGLEGLASLPGGGLLAMTEGTVDGAARVFTLRGDGRHGEGSLPFDGPQVVTGADLGPDGRLYVLRRDFSILAGVSIRVMRYRLAADGMPEAASAETLAAFGPASGIDNMEGIALDRGTDGTTWLWLISDDNFSPLQRTLLLRFEVLP